MSRPDVPQRNCLVAIGSFASADLRGALAALGSAIAAVTDTDNPMLDVTPDGPGDLSVMVGLGAGSLKRTSHPELAELVRMPAYRGDDTLPSERLGGDILVSVNATDPMVLEPVLRMLTETVGGFTFAWSEFGYRGPANDGVARNPLGYFDGIIRPQTAAEFTDDVWISSGPLAGGTICTIRRFQLATARFADLPQSRRDDVIGRHQQSGAPLSGGSRDDQIDLTAKTDSGELIVPANAHARAAHPSYTGSPLMLRRSYSYRASHDDHGHLFMSYQNDVQTFAKTQLRLDEVDALMPFATPTATAAFAVLPGFSADTPLGSSLF